MKTEKFRVMLTENVITPMLQFMQDCGEDAEYTKKDVAKCEKILSDYLTALAALEAPNNKDILKCVKKAVLALNKLNEQTDYALLETEERENIWELIQTSAVAFGLLDPADDIPEEWRDW